jgi:hypothetical protein
VTYDDLDRARDRVSLDKLMAKGVEIYGDIPAAKNAGAAMILDYLLDLTSVPAASGGYDPEDIPSLLGAVRDWRREQNEGGEPS